VRQLIESRLSGISPSTDPRARTLADVDGQVSSTLEAALAGPGQPAAVLLGLVERPTGLTVLFTLRAPHLSAHPGQVSLPGGRVESSDAGPAAAALREASEEIGLKPALVSVAGSLDCFLTITGFMVTPVVGFVDPAFEAVPDHTEVDAVFEVPLAYLLDDANVAVSHRQRSGTRFRIYEFTYGGHRIWGATASILMNFKSIIY
jgi:8-oxo-dGTP pyrophosphatase MutT (NUDIX family)